MFKFFLWALGLHILLLLLAFINFNFFSSKQPVVANNAIKAVAMNPTAVNDQIEKLKAAEQAKLNAERQRQEEIKKQEEVKKQAEQKKLEEQKKAEATKLETEKKANQKKIDDQKLKEEKIAQQKKEKQENTEKALEKQMEEKKKQLAAKKAKEDKEQSLQKQLAAETEEEVSAEAAAAAQGEVDRYKGLILSALQQHWIVPDNIPADASTTLLIRLAPGGMVLDVKLIKSSGDDALDRSAIAAVHKASPLPVPTDSHLFDKMREINLIVKPEGK